MTTTDPLWPFEREDFYRKSPRCLELAHTSTVCFAVAFFLSKNVILYKLALRIILSCSTVNCSLGSFMASSRLPNFQLRTIVVGLELFKSIPELLSIVAYEVSRGFLFYSFFLSLFFFLFLLFFFPFFQIQIRHIFAWHLRLIKLASASIHCLKLFRRFPLCFRNESKKFPSPKSGIFFIFESLQCHWTIGGTFFSFFDVNKSDDSYIFVFVSHFLFFIYLFISFFFSEWLDVLKDVTVIWSYLTVAKHFMYYSSFVFTAEWYYWCSTLSRI